MPLEAQTPRLDERTAEQIFLELRERIPVYAPEWTDYNESDPGITLLQLFAWLSESMLYQMNRVPERMYLKFLHLLQLELRPAQPATAHLSFTAATGVTELPALPPRTRVSLSATDGEDAIFETLAGLDLIPLELAHVLVYDGAAFAEWNVANAAGRPAWSPFGPTAQPGAALYLGFTPPEGTRPPRLFPQTMRFRVFLPAPTAGAPAVRAEGGLPLAVPPPVTLVWEYRPPGSRFWQELTTFRDESAAFTQEGYLEVEGPADADAFPVDAVTDPHVWLRCRLVAGVYPAGTAPLIAAIRPNVVAAEQLSTVRDEILGDSDGRPDQRFTLRRTPVQRDSLALHVRRLDDEGNGVRWTRVDDFLASNRESLHFTLNPTTGEVRFGDGERGRIPPAGQEILAVEYRYGGGARGNVPPGDGAVLGPAPGVDTVRAERDAVGGGDEQSVKELKARAPSVLRARNRAVSEEDFTELACQAGGVARARAIALMHPDYPGVAVPGAVTVLIVPDNADNPPVPSGDLLRSVAHYLHPFRLLTTELYVSKPRYRSVCVRAVVRADPYASPGTVERAAVAALTTFLDPRQWPFGGELYPTAFYDTLLEVPNLRAVDSLVVEVDGQPHGRLDVAVRLDRDELVYSGEHEIAVRPYRDW